MKEDHVDGHCDMCQTDTGVRWKNIYWNGSEGLVCCMKCEMKIVVFVRNLINEAYRAKKANYIATTLEKYKTQKKEREEKERRKRKTQRLIEYAKSLEW